MFNIFNKKKKVINEEFRMKELREQEEYLALPVDPMWQKIIDSLRTDEWEEVPIKNVFDSNAVKRKKDGLIVGTKDSYLPHPTGGISGGLSSFTVSVHLDDYRVSKYPSRKENRMYAETIFNLVRDIRRKELERAARSREEDFQATKAKYGL